MGVHGLTTYLRENVRALSKPVHFPSPTGAKVPVVVDGWSFIYSVYHDSRLPWVYGGEYPEFSKFIIDVIEGWIRLGLKIRIVFDGPYPDIKFPTIVSRLQRSHIQPALFFFRTSAASRASPRFLNETRILPTLSYPTCVHTLESFAKTTDALELHYADEEGDPYSVELAGRIGGYVIANDSDFAILNAPGYLGYIPLDEMVWESDTFDQSIPVDGDDGEFQMVRKPKTKKVHPGRRILPPESGGDLQMTCICYHPETLASHLQLPVTLLPLLGALVGNDFTNVSEPDRRSIQTLFFERRQTVVQRIEHAAAAMRQALSPKTPKKKNSHPVGSPMDLIDRTVNILLTRLINPLTSNEIEAIIDKVVMSTLQYAILRHDGEPGLWRSDICALHDPDICPILPMISRRVLGESDGTEGQTPALLQSAEIRAHFLQAYRRGQLSPKLLGVLATGTFWPRLFLENPDVESVSRSLTKHIHLWIYSILDDCLGLPVAEEKEEKLDDEFETQSDVQVKEEEDEGDENELIDVLESDDEETFPDFLTPLRGELQRLHISDDDRTETDAAVSVVSQWSNRIGKPQVTEYSRKGTRLVAETIPVPPLVDLLARIPTEDLDLDSDETISLIQKPIETRVSVFLRILESDTPSVRRLSSEQIPVVLAIRLVVRMLYKRALETGSRDREKEKWTQNEVRCCLAAFDTSIPNNMSPTEFPPIQDRNVQLTAQLLAALEAVEQLSESLLLTSFAPSVPHLFSGKLFHSYLTGSLKLPDSEALVKMWSACEDGLVDAISEDSTKKNKRARNLKENIPASPPVKKGSGVGFALLAGIEG